MPDVLIKNRYILYSRIEWSLLKEIAKHSITVGDNLVLKIHEDHISYISHDSAEIAQVELKMGKELFEEFLSVEGEICLDAKMFISSVEKHGKSGDVLGFLVEPDKAIIFYEDDEFEIPEIEFEKRSPVHDFEYEASASFIGEFLMNILESLDQDEVEVSLMNGGPIKITKRRFSDNLEVSYMLAPLAPDIKCQNLNRTLKLDSLTRSKNA